MKYRLRIIVLLVLAVSLVIISPTNTVAINGFYKENDILHYDKNAEQVTCQTSSGGFEGGGVPPANLIEFIDKYGQSAFNVGKQYGIPYEAILSQAALESGNGKSRLTIEANNFFGIKAGPAWTGPVWTGNTLEEVGGGNVNVVAKFRAYPNAEEGFKGYGEFITVNPRYAKALQFPQDPAKYIAEIKAAGYATDSSYITKNQSLISQIQTYIKSKNLFPPSSEVTPDRAPPAGSTTNNSVGGCNGNGNSPGTIAQVVSVAETELGKTPVEYDTNVMKYTTGRQEPWCADFVTWVFKEAGVPFSGGNDGWQIPAVLSLQAYFKGGQDGSEYFNVGDRAPQPGDVAFYIGAQTPDGGSTQHVNIVGAVDTASGVMTTIGGNESNKVKKGTRQIELDAESLVGFGRRNK